MRSVSRMKPRSGPAEPKDDTDDLVIRMKRVCLMPSTNIIYRGGFRVLGRKQYSRNACGISRSRTKLEVNILRHELLPNDSYVSLGWKARSDVGLAVLIVLTFRDKCERCVHLKMTRVLLCFRSKW